MQQHILPTPPSSSDGFSQQPTSTMDSHISHPQGTMSPEQSFAGYSYATRYSTPIREDDSSVYEPSTVYSQRSDVSFVSPTYLDGYSQADLGRLKAGYAGGLGITSHPYGPLPDEVGYSTHLPYTPEASPPAPCSTSDNITTRSGLSIAKKPLITKSPAVRSGRVQKRSRAEKANTASNLVSGPLSEAAKNHPNIQVADIETFVNRSTEERLSETSSNKKQGQIKRPMNAFMLYRKAYQEVAKEECSQNNHQHVSKVCGAGWRIEPPHIKEAFDQWARIERVNHQRAHPGYKFTPSKPRKARRDGDVDDEYSDNDSDWNGGRGLSSAARRSRYRHATRLSETSSTAYGAVGNSMVDPSMAPYHDMHAYSSHVRPSVLPYDHIAPNPYEISVHRYSGLNVSDEMGSRAASPGEFDYSTHGLDGFTHDYYGAAVSSYDTAAAPLFVPGPPYETYEGIHTGAPLGQESWIMESENDLIPVMGGYEDTTAQDAYLKGNKDDWKVEVMDEPGHFEDWYAQTEQGL